LGGNELTGLDESIFASTKGTIQPLLLMGSTVPGGGTVSGINVGRPALKGNNEIGAKLTI
jgi:hypothetical protein